MAPNVTLKADIFIFFSRIPWLDSHITGYCIVVITYIWFALSRKILLQIIAILHNIQQYMDEVLVSTVLEI